MAYWAVHDASIRETAMVKKNIFNVEQYGNFMLIRTSFLRRKGGQRDIVLISYLYQFLLRAEI